MMELSAALSYADNTLKEAFPGFNATMSSQRKDGRGNQAGVPAGVAFVQTLRDTYAHLASVA